MGDYLYRKCFIWNAGSNDFVFISFVVIFIIRFIPFYLNTTTWKFVSNTNYYCHWASSWEREYSIRQHYNASVHSHLSYITINAHHAMRNELCTWWPGISSLAAFSDCNLLRSKSWQKACPRLRGSFAIALSAWPMQLNTQTALTRELLEKTRCAALEQVSCV